MSSSSHQDFKININSFGLSSNQDSNVKFALINPVILSPYDAYDLSLSVESLSLPLKYYILNESNNKIKINSTILTIPEGNYNVNNLITTINQILLAFEIKVIYSNITNKISFISLNEQINTFTIGEGTTSQTPLGIIAGNYSLPHEADHAINLIYSNVVSIVVKNVQTLNQTVGPVRNTTTLLRLPLNVPSNSIFVFNNLDSNSSTVITNRILTNLEIDLENDFGESIDMKNSSYFLTLKVKFIKHEKRSMRDNIMKMVKDGTFKEENDEEKDDKDKK